jgi:hypothetical protein
MANNGAEFVVESKGEEVLPREVPETEPAPPVEAPQVPEPGDVAPTDPSEARRLAIRDKLSRQVPFTWRHPLGAVLDKLSVSDAEWILATAYHFWHEGEQAGFHRGRESSEKVKEAKRRGGPPKRREKWERRR